MDHTGIIDKIFKLRKKIGISQKDMAGMINVAGNTLSRWESKKNVPHKIFIKKMEEILKFKPRRWVENSDITEENK